MKKLLAWALAPLCALVAACAAPAFAATPDTYTDASGHVQSAQGVECLNPTTKAFESCATNTGTVTSTAALAANLVAKNAPGTLYGFEVQADATLAGAAWWVMISNATAAPADGAVTPAKCYAVKSGEVQFDRTFASGGIAFPTGIVIGVSTTGCFTKTASTHAFISADVQ